MNQRVYVDVEGPIRTWARAVAAITDIVGAGRVFFGVPLDAARPVLTMSRTGGSPQDGESPLEDPIISFHCWGSTKAQAAQLAGAVKTAVSSIRGGTPVGNIHLMGARVLNDIWSPDTSSDPDDPRYIVDVQFTTKAIV